MKWISLIVVAIIGFFAFQYYMKSNKIIYRFKEPIFKFTTTHPDTVVNTDLDFTTMEIVPWENGKLWVYFIYSEAYPNAQNLQSINVKVLMPDGTEVPYESQLDIDFYTKTIEDDKMKNIAVSKKNHTGSWNELIDWSKVNYKYSFLGVVYEAKDNRVTYKNDYKFLLNSYPDSLKFLVEIKWSNGERKFETTLTKEKYIGPKINPKF